MLMKMNELSELNERIFLWNYVEYIELGITNIVRMKKKYI